MERRATADTVRILSEEWYVYILLLSNANYYVGCTSDLVARLQRHTQGYVPSTCNHLPVKMIFYCAFPDKYKAYTFESYLKSGSGRAFTQRHLV